MNASLTRLVEDIVLKQMQRRASFTALDISNTLKTEQYPVRHSDVACAVREIFGSGAMDYYDYNRQLISVSTDTGPAQAFLYRHGETRGRDYTRRAQAALPPVLAEHARSLEDTENPTSLPRPASRRHRPTHLRVRRDGAVSVPRAMMLALGWQAGETLAVTAAGGTLALAQSKRLGETIVRVWQDGRVRICRRTLARAGLCAETVTLQSEGETLRIMAR